jgi:transposase-like protein
VYTLSNMVSTSAVKSPQLRWFKDLSDELGAGVVKKMSYCPECCSEEVDDIKKGNKRYYVCEVCGNEWVEDDSCTAKDARRIKQSVMNPQIGVFQD